MTYLASIKIETLGVTAYSAPMPKFIEKSLKDAKSELLLLPSLVTTKVENERLE